MTKNGLTIKRLFNGIITDYCFRTVFFSLCSLAFGVFYAIFSIFAGIALRSLRLFSLAVYYDMLDAVRCFILSGERKKRSCDYAAKTARSIRRYRACGIILISTVLFISAMIIHVTRQDNDLTYNETALLVTAGYTFYRIGLSIYNFFKAEKQRDYRVKALRTINLATALVSFLSLQSTVLAVFSTENKTTTNAVTGAIVCMLTVSLGMYVIKNASRQAESYRYDELLK